GRGRSLNSKVFFFHAYTNVAQCSKPDNRGKNYPYAIRFSVIAREGDTSEICIKQFDNGKRIQ
ncbi:hypothetical protein, partial [uncultured Chryseobacterium sp.]|uniref:hypothetical protein n=1 Tax=uncultured Chryseobacterium sp. TaxID=259322 RepID=UPI0025E9D224